MRNGNPPGDKLGGSSEPGTRLCDARETYTGDRSVYEAISPRGVAWGVYSGKIEIIARFSIVTAVRSEL